MTKKPKQDVVEESDLSFAEVQKVAREVHLQRNPSAVQHEKAFRESLKIPETPKEDKAKEASVVKEETPKQKPWDK